MTFKDFFIVSLALAVYGLCLGATISCVIN